MKLTSYSSNYISQKDKSFRKQFQEVYLPKIESKPLEPLGSFGEFDLFYVTGIASASRYTFFARDSDGEIVAMLNVLKSSRVARVVNSLVFPGFSGHGLGFRLYEVALETFGSLESSHSLSKGSSQLWKKLIEKYSGELLVGTNKINRVRIHGWESFSGFAYPLVNAGGELKSIRVLAKRSAAESKAVNSCYFRAYK